jgi:hypothetical protein
MSDHKPAPVYMLVTLPPADLQDEARATIARTAIGANGHARRVDQHALLVELLVRATPAMHALVEQVLADPTNPKWQEYRV